MDMGLDFNTNAKSYPLLMDICKQKNLKIFNKNEVSINDFKKKYSQFSDKLFFDLCVNFGGAYIQSWIRLYGCGQINIVEKNKKYNSNTKVDIIIAEDILGGLFGIKDRLIWYYAPDLLTWENLQIYYANFMDWLLNNSNGVEQFYSKYRWTGWNKDLENLNIEEGIILYPFVFTREFNIDTATKKVVLFDEIVFRNFEFEKKFNN